METSTRTYFMGTRLCCLLVSGSSLTIEVFVEDQYRYCLVIFGQIKRLSFLGDYLLATCLKNLGGLRNNAVTELISTGLRDLVEGDFFGEHDDLNNPLPTIPKGKTSQLKILRVSLTGTGILISLGPITV